MHVWQPIQEGWHRIGNEETLLQSRFLNEVFALINPLPHFPHMSRKIKIIIPQSLSVLELVTKIS